MSVIRIRILEILACYIQDAIPELRCKVIAGPAEAPQKLQFPHLSITAIRYKFFPDQEELWHEQPTTSCAVLRVGRHEGFVQLRLGATTHRKRAYLEQKLLDLFLVQQGRPGILVTQIPDCFDATVAWELEGDEWENEKAFDKSWFSILTVTVQVPALVTRPGVYSIEELRVGLTEDLDSPVDLIPTSAIEETIVNEDGTMTPVT